MIKVYSFLVLDDSLKVTQRPIGRVANKVRVEGGEPYFYIPKYRSSDALPAPEIFNNTMASAIASKLYQLLKPQNVACCPVYPQRVSHVLPHALTKVKNFERVASKTHSMYKWQCLTIYMSVASKNVYMQRIKTTWKHLYYTRMFARERLHTCLRLSPPVITNLIE